MELRYLVIAAILISEVLVLSLYISNFLNQRVSHDDLSFPLSSERSSTEIFKPKAVSSVAFSLGCERRVLLKML
jgi:hypothetical protein